MPGLVPGIHVFVAALKTWIAGTSASGSDAVLRTAKPGHDGKIKARALRRRRRFFQQHQKLGRRTAKPY
jgi:hypothetical protein